MWTCEGPCGDSLLEAFCAEGWLCTRRVESGLAPGSVTPVITGKGAGRVYTLGLLVLWDTLSTGLQGAPG